MDIRWHPAAWDADTWDDGVWGPLAWTNGAWAVGAWAADSWEPDAGDGSITKEIPVSAWAWQTIVPRAVAIDNPEAWAWETKTPGYIAGKTYTIPEAEWAWETIAPRAIGISNPDAWAWEAITPRAFVISNPEAWAWTTNAPVDNILLAIPEAEWAWVSVVPRAFPIRVESWAWLNPSIIVIRPADVTEWAWTSTAPASRWTLPAATPRREIFICVLRADGLADVEVPMSSLQIRRRNGNPTMVQAVVPDAMTSLEYAEDREGGEIIIYAGSLVEDGTRHLSELERAALESIVYDVGVGSSSLTLSGYRTETNENPRPIDLEGITYYGLQADGKRRVRGKVDIFLRPGDTAVFMIDEEESFEVEQIYIKVTHSNSWMEAAGL